MSLSFVNMPILPLSGRWKHGSVPVVGLIGAIGGGKSQVASLLKARGAIVIDADALGHEALEQPGIRRRLIDRFGPKVARGGNESASSSCGIDRQALGSIVFADASALQDLEAIVHPEIRRRCESIMNREIATGRAPAIVVDAALLLEAGWHELCDVIVFVDAPRVLRLRRVMERSGWTDAMLAAREAAQWTDEAKRAGTHGVLRNDSTLEELEHDVDALFHLLTGQTSHEAARTKSSAGAALSQWHSSEPAMMMPRDAR
jgi:dephospho-CoA kinase